MRKRTKRVGESGERTGGSKEGAQVGVKVMTWHIMSRLLERRAKKRTNKGGEGEEKERGRRQKE